MTKIDVVLTEIIRNRLIAATEEMAKTLIRTAFNPLLYEVQDFGVSIMSATGDLWAETPGCTIFSRALPDVIRNGIRRWGDAFKEGDVLIANDPYETGTHISDTSVYMPAFYNGELVAFCGSTAHWADIGGKNPGGWCPDTTDVYQEGICFRHQKLMAAGVKNQAIWDLIADNVRVPKTVKGDLEAQIACCLQGVERVKSLCAKYGVATVRASIAHVIKETDRAMRNAIAKIPDGEFGASIRLDSDGVNPNGEFLICLKATVKGEQVRFSLRGSSDTAIGPVNLPAIGTIGTLASVLKGLLMPHDPTNEGHAMCLEFDLPPGLIVSPVRPAPVDSYGYCIECLTELMFRAFAGLIPDRCPAGGFQMFALSLARSDARYGEPFVMMDVVDGGNGGQPAADGATMMFIGNGDVPNIPVEVLETRYPVRVTEMEFAPEVAGAGKFRGGCGLRKDYLLLESGAYLMFTSENTKDPTAVGFNSGHTGAPGKMIVNPGSPNERVFKERTSGIGPFPAGTLIRAQSGGGGGWGAPKDRDPALVLADVRNGFLSADDARRLYGVALSKAQGKWQVDAPATQRLRVA
ncbi:MAG: hypothetical protein DCC73_06350 [Proteobacteria bacterium]|nr:MAG: hypothetical protein DCC73_06350 [Pseudomonadota bacterium]